VWIYKELLHKNLQSERYSGIFKTIGDLASPKCQFTYCSNKNHSKNFWAEMNRLIGDGKKLKREMREYRLGV
jgi:hypothetical protein